MKLRNLILACAIVLAFAFVKTDKADAGGYVSIGPGGIHIGGGYGHGYYGYQPIYRPNYYLPYYGYRSYYYRPYRRHYYGSYYYPNYGYYYQPRYRKRGRHARRHWRHQRHYRRW